MATTYKYYISIKVIDALSNAISGATVKIYAPNGTTILYNGTTSSSGLVTWGTNTAYASCLCKVTKTGYVAAQKSAIQSGSTDTTTPITLTPTMPSVLISKDVWYPMQGSSYVGGTTDNARGIYTTSGGYVRDSYFPGNGASYKNNGTTIVELCVTSSSGYCAIHDTNSTLFPVAKHPFVYDISSDEQAPTLPGLSASGRKILSTHYVQDINHTYGSRWCVTAKSGQAVYNGTYSALDTWASYTDKSGINYYAITATSNDLWKYKTISVTKDYRYTFTIHTYTEGGVDGVILSTKTFESSLLNDNINTLKTTDIDGVLKYESGVNYTSEYTYHAQSTGTLYLYFYTNSSILGDEITTDGGGISYDNYSYASVKVVKESDSYAFAFYSDIEATVEGNTITSTTGYTKTYLGSGDIVLPRPYDASGSKYCDRWYVKLTSSGINMYYDIDKTHNINDFSILQLYAEWKDKTTVEIPTVKDVVYNGSEQTTVSVDESIITPSGTTGTDVGLYWALFKLVDTDHYMWSDNSTGNKGLYKWSITQRPTTVTANSNSKIYDGTAIVPPGGTGCTVDASTATNLVDGHACYSRITMDGDGINAGTYKYTPSDVNILVDETGDEVTSNYAITLVDGTGTVYKKSVNINYSLEQITYHTVYCTDAAEVKTSLVSAKTVSLSETGWSIDEGDGTISYEFNVLNTDTGDSFSGWSLSDDGKTLTIPSGTEVGQYLVDLQIEVSESTNYSSASDSRRIIVNVKATSVSSYGDVSAPTISSKSYFPASGGTLSTSNITTYFNTSGSSQTITYNNGATRNGSISYTWSGSNVSIPSLGTTITTSTTKRTIAFSYTATGEGGKSSSASVTSIEQGINSASYPTPSGITYSQKADFPASGVTLTSSNIGSYLTPSASQTITFTSGSTRSGSITYSWSGSYTVSNLGSTEKARTSLTLTGLVCTATGEGSKSINTPTPTGYQAANNVTATATEYGEYANSVSADKTSFEESGGSSTVIGAPLAKSRTKYTWTSGSVSYSGWSDYITGSGGSWSVNVSWITLGTASGNNMPFSVEKNTVAARSGVITYTYEGIAKTITISQAVATYYLDLNSNTMDTSGSYVWAGGLPAGATADVYIDGSLDSTANDWYQKKPYGTTYTIKNFTNTTGFTFNATKSGYTAASGTSGTVLSAVSVAPYYDRNKYTLSWSSAGGSLSGGTSAGSVYYGAGLTAPTATKTGYDFVEWSPSVPSTMPASNATYTATWSAKTIRVNFNANDGSLPGTGSGKSYVDITYDTTAGKYPSITLPSRTGYTFAGYFDASSGGTQYYNSTGIGVRTFDKASETTLYAQWTLNYFTLSIASGSVTNYTISITKSSTYGGTVGNYTATSNAAQNISVPYGASYSISWASGTDTETTSGFTITWDGNGGSSPSATTSGNKTRTRSATNPTSSSNSITGNVSISANGWGSYGGYTYGTVGTLPSSSQARYTFAGWWTAASGGTQITTNTRPTSAVTYYAHWTANTVAVPTAVSTTSSVKLTYNGAAQTGISGYNASYMTYTGSLSATNAGSYSATFVIGSNYMWADGSTTTKTVSWYIGKANQTAPTALGSSVTYNATATASASGGGQVGSIEWSNGSSRSAIGSQSTQARWSGNDNYNASTWSSAVTLTVSKYTTSITLSATDRIYNGSALYATAYVNFPSGGKTPKGTIYYGTSSGATTYSASYSGSSVALSSVNVVNNGATTTVYAYFVPDTTCNDVYNQSGNVSRKLTITGPAASTLPTTWSGDSKSYHNTATVTATGYSGGTLNYRTSTDNSTWGSWSATKPSRTAVGTTYVQCYVVGDSNHSDSSVSSSVSITINKASDAAMDISLSSGLIYTGSGQILAKAGSNVHGISTYYIGYNTSKSTAADSEVTWGSANGSVSATTGGTYYIYYKFSPDGNHSNIKSCTYVGSVVITAANGYGTVSISNWTYGQTASNPTASGSSSSITYTWYDSSKTQLSSRPSSTSAVGTYYIKATFAANSNYKTYTTDYVSFIILDTILSHNPVASIGEGISAGGGYATVTGQCTRTWASGKTDTSAISKVEITSNGNSRFSVSGTTISHSSMGTNVTTDTVQLKITFADGSIYEGDGVKKSVSNAITAHSATTSISNNFSAAGGYGDVTGSCTRTYTSGSTDSVGISKVEITSNGNSRFSVSGTRVSHSSMGTDVEGSKGIDAVSVRTTFTDSSTATATSVNIVNKLESIALTLTPSTIKYGATSTPATKATYTSGAVAPNVSATYISSDTNVAKVE